MGRTGAQPVFEVTPVFEREFASIQPGGPKRGRFIDDWIVGPGA